MTARWEQRVTAALVSPQYAPLDVRFRAGMLVAQTRLFRWGRRAGIVVLATVTAVVALVAIPATVALVYLLHAL
jgi:hypothetical protein